MYLRFRGHRPARAGFTLVELMVVIAIAGLLMAIAIPYFGQVMRRARVESEARTISSTLLQARLQAIKRGANVLVEFSTDSSKLSLGSYHKAVVYLDTGGTAGALDATDTVLGRSGIASGADTEKYYVDDAGKPSPSTSAATIEFVFTPFGSMNATSTAKSIYIGDTKGNLLQIAIPAAAQGKILTTKLAGSTFVGRPWTWS
jgi:type IV fimbrial biogenesis protein FimT